MKRFQWRKWIYASMIGIASLPVFSQVWDQPVIYGKDNRLDLYESENAVQIELARSTFALVRADNVRSSTQAGFSQLSAKVFGEEAYMCKDERFYDQWVAAFCSGFLVTEDIAVTAGHCVRNADECTDTAFVFDFSMTIKDADSRVVPTSSVYHCAELIHTAQNDTTGADFAVVRLDRSVTDRPPLPLRASGEPAPKDPLFVIGHPSGLPTKLADGASVRSLKKGFFVADLDTYGGNSGSAVFNAKTGSIEGILVRGETDFVYMNGCYRSKVCDQAGCRGEDVTRISEVLQYLK